MAHKLTKSFRFESAHRLCKGYKGKCSNIHGHSWNGHIELECKSLDEFDMGVDFKLMGEFIKAIEKEYDHKLILCKDDTELIDLCSRNEWAVLVTKDNPTCETLAGIIYRDAELYFSALPIRVKSVRIEETCTTSCTYE